MAVGGQECRPCCQKVRHNLKPCSQSSAADRVISSRLPLFQYHTLHHTHTTYTLTTKCIIRLLLCLNTFISKPQITQETCSSQPRWRIVMFGETSVYIYTVLEVGCCLRGGCMCGMWLLQTWTHTLYHPYVITVVSCMCASDSLRPPLLLLCR